ncbi:MAG: CocE/NonD family hydrolase, partial [Verrucomicrobiae bacterium]|nr:CocE/NonD family hydrolase [Verrucomicrobiae bacterium]
MKTVPVWEAMLALGILASLSAEETRQSSNKHTFMIRMRDGVRLATDVYLPAGQGPFPTVLIRTPYNKDGLIGFGLEGVKRGYAVVVQDTRGRFASEGANLPFEADGWGPAADGLDTVNWLVKQTWCNGRIGTYGGSALGITQLLLAGTGTTNISCQHITVAAPGLYHHAVYPGGVFKKSMVEDWLRMTKFDTNALIIWVSHPNHDAYWRERELNRRWHLVNAPAIHIGGWFDIFAQGTIDAFLGYQHRGGPMARGRQRLLMGPWTHAVFTDKAGDLTFPNAKKPPGISHDVWKWMDYHLQNNKNGVDQEPTVTYYVMGDVTDPKAPGNAWRTAPQWPPKNTTVTSFYFDTRTGSLTTKRPDRLKSISYVYDPHNPVPTVGGPQLTIPAGPKDQSLIEYRSDVVVFSSTPLTRPLEVTGRVRCFLWASSDAPDTDWFVRLCDVYPDGRSFNICEGQLRARHRVGFDREDFLEKDRPFRFDIDLWSTSIV